MVSFERGFTLVTGNMFGYKTSEMFHYLNKEKAMNRKVQLFKIGWDQRYGKSQVTTHDGAKFPAFAVKNTEGIKRRLNLNTEVIGIDEAQFFDEAMVEFILSNMNRYMIVATALQHDFRGNPFPFRSPKGVQFDSEMHIGDLMPHAKIVPRYSECTYAKENEEPCRKDAIYIQRFREDGSLAPYSDPTIVVGGTDRYKPRCLEHFVVPPQ